MGCQYSEYNLKFIAFFFEDWRSIDWWVQLNHSLINKALTLTCLFLVRIVFVGVRVLCLFESM